MQQFKQSEVWFVIGSQHLYGQRTLQQVKEQAEKVVSSLNQAGLPVKLVQNRWQLRRMKSRLSAVMLTIKIAVLAC